MDKICEKASRVIFANIRSSVTLQTTDCTTDATNCEVNKWMDKPNRIYNMDESGMPLDHWQLNFIAPKGPWTILREEHFDYE